MPDKRITLDKLQAAEKSLLAEIDALHVNPEFSLRESEAIVTRIKDAVSERIASIRDDIEATGV